MLETTFIWLRNRSREESELRGIMAKVLTVTLWALTAPFGLIGVAKAQNPVAATSVQIPKTWDGQGVAALEVPLANPAYSPVHVTSDYYYRMPARTIYKSYPIFAPGKGPAGYLDWLKEQEPEIVFDAAKLKTEADWVRAGEIVFEAPISYVPVSSYPLDDPEFYVKSGILLASDGTLPIPYVIRKKGVVEVGELSCADCHSRIMPDGTILKGAQGNQPHGRLQAFKIRQRAAQADDEVKQLARVRRGQHMIFGAPWIQTDPSELMSLSEIAAARGAIPPGVAPAKGRVSGMPCRYPT